MGGCEVREEQLMLMKIHPIFQRVEKFSRCCLELGFDRGMSLTGAGMRRMNNLAGENGILLSECHETGRIPLGSNRQKTSTIGPLMRSRTINGLVLKVIEHREK